MFVHNMVTVCTVFHNFLPQSRPEMPLDDVTALYTSLVNLALKCYSDRIDYVDKALECTLNVITKREAAP